VIVNMHGRTTIKIETTIVYCAVRTERLNIMQFNFSLQMLGSMKHGELLD
jgi:hypothetical protein